MWPPFAADLELQPPKSYALPERPKKSKKKDVDEAKKKPIRQSATKRCGNFKSFRHNKTTCTKQPATSGATTSAGIGRGRPRGGGECKERFLKLKLINFESSLLISTFFYARHKWR